MSLCQFKVHFYPKFFFSVFSSVASWPAQHVISVGFRAKRVARKKKNFSTEKNPTNTMTATRPITTSPLTLAKIPPSKGQDLLLEQVFAEANVNGTVEIRRRDTAIRRVKVGLRRVVSTVFASQKRVRPPEVRIVFESFMTILSL